MGGSASSPVLLRSYRGIVEIVIESAALYMLTLVAFLAFFIQDDARSTYPQAILNIVTVSQLCILHFLLLTYIRVLLLL